VECDLIDQLIAMMSGGVDDEIVPPLEEEAIMGCGVLCTTVSDVMRRRLRDEGAVTDQSEGLVGS
jgi:hypothetical protein